MNKKKILSLALVVLLICTISFGTLAWFNATDEVTNTFKVATSDGEGTPDFSISVLEKEVNEDGQETGEYVDDGNTYSDILPGDCLPKNVNIYNTGTYDQWVRIHVTFSDSAVWQQAIEKARVATNPELDFTTYVVNKMIKSPSTEFCETPVEVSFNKFGPDTMTFTYYYTNPLKGSPSDSNTGTFIWFMKNFTIPGVLEQEDMNFGTDGFTLTIKAEAVQVDNLKATNAPDAFKEVVWEVGSEYGA